MFVSEVIKTPPKEFATSLQEKVYKTLAELEIPFERVDTGDAVTMEDCIDIDKKLGCKVVKTLFLCNRQKTAFYLFVTPGDKPFVTKDFGKALGVVLLIVFLARRGSKRRKAKKAAAPQQPPVQPQSPMQPPQNPQPPQGPKA